MAAKTDILEFRLGAPRVAGFVLVWSALLGASGYVQAQVAPPAGKLSPTNPPASAGAQVSQLGQGVKDNSAQPGARAALGVRTSKNQANFVTLGKVEPGSPADKAGLRAGDEVLAINGVPVKSSDDVSTALRMRDGRNELKIQIERDGHLRVMTLRAGNLGSPPASTSPSEQGSIGITMSDQNSTRGVTLAAIAPGGPAAEAGLKVGDLVVAVDGKPVNSYEALQAMIQRHAPGEEMDLTVRRDGWRRDVLLIAVDHSTLADLTAAARAKARAAAAAAAAARAALANSAPPQPSENEVDSPQDIDDPNLRALYTDFD